MFMSYALLTQPSDIIKSSILPGDKLWTSPVPYVLDNGLGKYTFF